MIHHDKKEASIMRIDNYATLPQRGASVRSTETESNSAAKSRVVSDTDTVTISEEARQATIVSQLEQCTGLSPEAAEKLASGSATIAEPDWDPYEVPTLQVNLEPMLSKMEGIVRFDNISSLAKDTAQAACDAAQKELNAKIEEEKAQKKEQFQQQIKHMNVSGSGTCLGFMTLG